MLPQLITPTGQASRAAARFCAKSLTAMAVPEGVEPPTFGLGNRCSIRLSYGTVGAGIARGR